MPTLLVIGYIAEQGIAIGILAFLLGFVIGDKGGRSAERSRRAYPRRVK